MRICRADVDRIDLEPLRPFVAGEGFFWNKEHYRLLAHLSKGVTGGTIFDIGTHLGDSAVALSYGGARVETFYVVDSGRPLPPNVHRNVVGLWSPAGREEWGERLLASPLIFIDMHPHEGTRERELVDWLQAGGFNGIIILDDIWYFKPMRDNCWYRINGKYRADATALGHWSGTGLVSFGERVEVEGQADTSNWTLVTGYFDLTKKDDASAELRARPASYFLDDNGSSVLTLDQNLVVYCEPSNEAKFWAMRPAHLHARTRVVVQEFEDFPLSKYRARIIANRGGSPWCPTHPRSTASYYLFCMARYAMLKQTISDNPFGSTHFAWINVCIERMGYQNLIHLNEALGVQRDKFSTCFIDYFPKSRVQDLSDFFGGAACLGRCTMCSGFFTGNAEYMRAVCDRLEAAFVRCLDAGFGHSDEQLYPMVYFAEPDLFDWYLGDYSEMVTNYAHVYDRAEQPIVNLIRNSLAAGDQAVCARACELLWQSFAAGTCTIGQPYLDELLRARARTLPREEPSPNTSMILGVPVLNRYDLLGRLIASAETGTCKPSAYLIVDNGGEFWRRAPTMPGVREARARGAAIDVLTPAKNIGVAASWNVLLDRAGDAPIAIANDDVVLGTDALEALGRAARIHDFVIAEGPPGANGWCLFAQTARCTRLVGPYDENFFPAYYEDSDYGRRLLLAGVYAHREPASLQHDGWATMRADPTIADGQRRSAEYFRQKWGGLPHEPEKLFREPFNGSPNAPALCRRIIGGKWKRYETMDEGGEMTVVDSATTTYHPRGQAGQDRFAVAVTGLTVGTFLDVGSGDPIQYSNSCMLEERGWTGLLVDRANDKDVTTYRRTPFLQADALAVDWPAALAAHGLGRARIDYLSFDLDDDGAAALARLPWATVRFSALTVEHDCYRFGDGPRAAMRSLLLGHGYRLLCPDVCIDGFGSFEDWWVDPAGVDAARADRFATTTPTRWQEIVEKGE